ADVHTLAENAWRRVRRLPRRRAERSAPPRPLAVAASRWRFARPGIGLLRHARGQPVGGAGDLVTQLEVVGQAGRIERTGLDRGAHRAARFALVAAVAEAALLRQRLELAKAALGERLFAGGLEFAHARGVDQAGARGQRDQPRSEERRAGQ